MVTTPEITDQERKAAYLEDLARHHAAPTPDWLAALRKQGASRFGELAYPHRKMEAWRFTDVRPIINTEFQSVIEPPAGLPSPEAVRKLAYDAPDWTQLVFVDGFYCAELSSAGSLPEGAYAGSLAQALTDEHPVAREHLCRHAGMNGNVFAALNSAFLTDGLFLHLPRGAAAAPVHAIFLRTGAAARMAAYPRNLVVLDEQAEGALVETYADLTAGAGYFNNVVAETALNPDAKLQRIKVVREHDESFHLATDKVAQGRASAYRSFTITLSGRIVRNELKTHLGGEGADASFNGLYTTDDSMLVDNHTEVEHAAPHCHSWIGYKGVLDDKSHAVFTGRVYVHQDAQKTDSNQLNQNYLLSDKATVDTKPQLEIFADDVKCTHGATVGQPPEQVVFYFQTRGIDRDTARSMLTYGFAEEVIADLPLEPVRKRLEAVVFDKYRPENRP